MVDATGHVNSLSIACSVLYDMFPEAKDGTLLDLEIKQPVQIPAAPASRARAGRGAGNGSCFWRMDVVSRRPSVQVRHPIRQKQGCLTNLHMCLDAYVGMRLTHFEKVRGVGLQQQQQYWWP